MEQQLALDSVTLAYIIVGCVRKLTSAKGSNQELSPEIKESYTDGIFMALSKDDLDRTENIYEMSTNELADVCYKREVEIIKKEYLKLKDIKKSLENWPQSEIKSRVDHLSSELIQDIEGFAIYKKF